MIMSHDISLQVSFKESYDILSKSDAFFVFFMRFLYESGGNSIWIPFQLLGYSRPLSIIKTSSSEKFKSSGFMLNEKEIWAFRKKGVGFFL